MATIRRPATTGRARPAAPRRRGGLSLAHHEGAITMAKEEIARGAHPDATALARQIVTAQQGEIDAIRKMLDRL
ncbi:DUF305 domain-containing protein [Micromonospora chersina]|uniref:DUF305 domain-containing protein n=1 Tax=Micromonospora chersina TaxID=47854 RepID=UPI0037B3DD75